MNEKMKFDIFQGKKICLAPIDMDKDPDVVSRWSHDSSYLQNLDASLARPVAPPQAKKILEELEKEMDKSERLYHFTIRSLKDDRLLGTTRISWIEWASQTGSLLIGIGDPADRGKGYGTETLHILLRFAFDELNLYRLSAGVPDFNTGAQQFFRRAGFKEEARLREAIHRGGQRWDQVLYGLLREEWQQLGEIKGGAS